MLTLEDERGHLAKADRDLAEGERRISAQMLMIEHLRATGHGTDAAERLLLTLRETLEAWLNHRVLIVEAITRLEGASPTVMPGGAVIE
ncbi:MAG: hypothetical protein ACRYGC_15670 [Janthinobacterium lividum]